MPPQATGPLENQVDRRKIGHDEIEVEVEALFGDLGGDQDFSAVAFPFLLPKTARASSSRFCRRSAGKRAWNRNTSVPSDNAFLPAGRRVPTVRRQETSDTVPVRLYGIQERQAHAGGVFSQLGVNGGQIRRNSLQADGLAAGRIRLEMRLINDAWSENWAQA